MNFDETGAMSFSSQNSEAQASGAHVHADGAGTSSSKAAAAALFNTKKYREEYDNAKSRLMDQKFSISEFPDPLLPRRGPHPKAYPRGQTVELEQRLKALIQKIREEQA